MEHLYPVFVLDPHFLKPDRRVDARLLALEGQRGTAGRCAASRQGTVLQQHAMFAGRGRRLDLIGLAGKGSYCLSLRS